MALAIVYSRASSGITAPLVTVETHLSYGLPKFHIVGLPEAAVKESRDRVRSALMTMHFEFPARHITVNLAPADLPKEGGRFDLPIALGILAASGQIPKDKLEEYEFTGELALSGELRKVRGILPVVLGAKKIGRSLIVPKENANEAALVKADNVFAAQHLSEVCAHLIGEKQLPLCEISDASAALAPPLDLVDVRGQPFARRALEIAAAGGHSLLFIGPPGTGKTMLATRLPGLLPPLEEEMALEVAAIASISSNGFDSNKWLALPFRSPHHTTSSVALVGGGRPPRPGEISLAHRGVLFLDELPEFNRAVLESLREPLESGFITISRAAFQTVFPAYFQLIAAMNPCPCGYAGSPLRPCQCSVEQVKRYFAKISGPLLDRIDMHVEVPALAPDVLAKSDAPAERSEFIRVRVTKARALQQKRQAKINAQLQVNELALYCQLEEAAQDLLIRVMQKFNFSARVYHRIIKLARTVADLEGRDLIDLEHISQALTYRCLDRANSVC
ncbi:MAG: YifB family Mg chelatase-like AAA ATPase [Gammaproteobacteria bacterium]|nr:YifB family Mg chelatase-like AAA ATPase [Gammaproteobacteria bacterium]